MASKSDIAKLIKETDITAYPAKDRILAAALKLFVEQGYFNTNVPDLSRESKCSVGSIYHCFSNKEEIAASLYNEGITSFRNALDRSVEGVDNVEGVIKTVVKSFLIFSELNYQLSKYMWLSRHGEFMSGNIKHPTFIGFDRLGRRLTKTIKDGVRNKQIKHIKANVIWSILFGIPLSYVRDWLDGYNTEPPSKVAEEIADACWKALT